MKEAGKKKIELLAPAGNFSALKGAIMAGADAVYLGGNRFGARAYAENFTEEEICEGIRMAHVFGRRVYLTVNTLIKDREIDPLCAFLQPFYECGLDGVIVQDLGALRVIRENFPELLLHASTQLTLTGVSGVRLLQKAGVSRIVPARELSLKELTGIKKQTGVEIEVFVHGAMCYCYSGQCLFSSMLGGRSGNRGRCAQPCRLPYRVNDKKECFPLSMRDMCALPLLPELIGAGMDSLKIEGRMKKPAYAAGVTAIYRKYIDAYEEDPEGFYVDPKDMAELRALYIRSELSEGYYHRHSGRDMLTLDSSAYSGSDEGQLAELERKYIQPRLCRKADARVTLQPGKPAELFLRVDGLSVSETGEIVQPASRQPLTREKVAEQIEKSGNSLLEIRCTDVKMEGEVFLPVRALNELRRRAVERTENLLIREQGLTDQRNPDNTAKVVSQEDAAKDEPTSVQVREAGAQIHVAVRTWQQFQAARDAKAARIYLDYHLICEKETEYLEEAGKGTGSELFLMTPYVMRSHNMEQLEKLKAVLGLSAFGGILIKNLEAAAYFETCGKQIVLDSNLYFWNRQALDEVQELFSKVSCPLEFVLPVECNIHEWKVMAVQGLKRGMKASAQVYGRLPMMVTANCIRKTAGNCTGMSGWKELTDRYHKKFPVYTDCKSCYNIIYNSVPLSLHQMVGQKELTNISYRLDLTTETGSEAERLIRYFQGECREEPSYQEYTTGHYKRGAE